MTPRLSAAEIAKRNGGHRSGQSWVLKSCPVCGYHDASVRDGDGGRLLFTCFGNGCSFADFLAVLRADGLMESNPDRKPPSRFIATSNPEAKATLMGEIARRIWSETVPAPGTAAELYLRGRGVTLSVPPTIRFAPALLHKPTGQNLPAMVAAFARCPESRVVAIHRTFLAADGSGKAPVRQQKMTLGPVQGAAIRLAPAGPVLVVAEGIETAASAMLATGLPAWAAFSAGNLKELVLPPLPLAAEVIIAADHDANGVGQAAAFAAGERWQWEGRRVRVALPPTPDTDWNDMLRGAP